LGGALRGLWESRHEESEIASIFTVILPAIQPHEAILGNAPKEKLILL
jgi:hypothetical protein